MAMLRLADVTGRSDLVRLVVSARRPAELYYSSELPGPGASILYTRSVPAGWPRAVGRSTASDIPPLAELDDVTAYVCGSTGSCDTAGELSWPPANRSSGSRSSASDRPADPGIYPSRRWVDSTPST
jgi:hypothetical protein